MRIEEPATAENNYIGRSIPRVDGFDKVTGKALFPGDLQMDGQVYLKVVFARRPHARILALDPTTALRVPGVLTVLTAGDVPVNRYGIEISDQPVLCADKVLFYGDRIALVVAESEQVAARAAGLIWVEFEDLPVLDSPQAALAPGAPTLHVEKPDNVLVSYQIERGDVEAGFLQSDLILDHTYRTGAQEHAYLQPDAGLAWIDRDGCLVVKSAGQWAHDDRRQIAEVLGLEEERVRIEYAHIGGAFGGREDLNIQVCLALAAWKVGRPVKAVWSREETTIGHPKRHPMQIRHKWGVSRHGKILAQQIEIIADAGAYASTSPSVLSTTVMLCSGPYEAEHVRVQARSVYTNNPVSGAFRGFGAPQAVFSAEAHMSRLARELSLDPVELRMRNLVQEGSTLATAGRLPPGVSARETLKAAAHAAGWENGSGFWKAPAVSQPADPNKRVGIGIAAGWKPMGYSLGWQEEATVKLELIGGAEIDQVWVSAPVADLGQGVHTLICQIVSQALHLPMERVILRPTETKNQPSVGPSSASRLTLMAGNALIEACGKALTAWNNEERPAVVTHTYKAPKTFDFGELSRSHNASFAIGFLAQIAILEVDIETGQIGIQRLISAHQVGKALNPQALTGQIQGGAIQGLGWTSQENFIVREGMPLTTEMSTYLIPTVMDVPVDFETILLENPNPTGPWGAVGIGEMPLLGVAPAVRDALQNAIGIWSDQIPIPPERIWGLLNHS